MIQIKQFTFNPIQENTYVVWDDTMECIIVDAGNYGKDEDSTLEAFVAGKGLKPVMAVNTHGHFDHTMGLGFVIGRWHLRFAMSSLDSYLSGATMFGIKTKEVPAPDTDLDAVDTISFGNTTLRVIKTPGHTPGGVCLYDEEGGNLFTGDSLFRESIGRTDLEGGDYPTLMHSLIGNVINLGDEVRVYPGHGESSSLGHETLYNPFITEVINKEVNID